MKKIILLFILILDTCFFNLSSAQTFNGGFGYILDNQEITIPITVSGLPNSIDATFGLKKVCLSIHHTYDGDLKIIVRSPNGDSIILAGNLGGGGNDFTNSCFHEDAPAFIDAGTPPFTGDWKPVLPQSLNLLNNGQNPNGTWYLCVKDEVPNDSGHVIFFSYEFGANPPATPLDSACDNNTAFGCSCPDGSQNCDLLPDMINSSHQIQLDHTEDSTGITLGTATPNIGYGPLEIHGINQCYCDTTPVSCSSGPCPGGASPTQLVNQRIWHKNGATLSYTDIPAGTMSYHPTHGHIHVDHWVYNTLRIKGPNPDPTTWPIIGEGTKVSFCLINLGDCDANFGNCVDNFGQVLHLANIPNVGLGTVTGCSANQGIYNGHLDIYTSGLNNPIPTDNICNGLYYIVSTTDPYNAFQELDETNNSSITPIVLTQQTGGNCCNANFYADTLNGNAPFQVQFADSTLPSPTSWVWDFGDGFTSTQQFPIHIYAATGNYTVTLNTNSSVNNCSSTKTRTQYINVLPAAGVPGQVVKENLNLIAYPNPVTDETTVSYFLNEPVEVNIFITDITGKEIILLENGWQPRGKNTGTFSMKNLPAGIYFLKAKTGSLEQTIKLVKVN